MIFVEKRQTIKNEDIQSSTVQASVKRSMRTKEDTHGVSKICVWAFYPISQILWLRKRRPLSLSLYCM